MRSWLFALAFTLPTVAFAQDAPVVEVQLSSFDFTPAEIHLHAGQPVVLRLTNTGSGGHNFAAPQFFAAAAVAEGQNAIRDGTIEVGSNQSVSVRLTPARGTYRLRCTHTMHTMFGMKGSIVVE